LNIEGAGGHTLPYLGFIEVNIGIPNIGLEPTSCILLVVPDNKFTEKLPVLLGTNILRPMMDAIEKQHGVQFQQKAELSDAWRFTFRCMAIHHREINRSHGKLAIIKCAMTNKVIIPSSSTVTIPGRIDKHILTTLCTGITESTRESNLPAGVSIPPLLVNLGPSSTCVAVQVSNLTNQPIVVSPNSIICQIHACEPVSNTDNSQLRSNPVPDVIDQINVSTSSLTESEQSDVYKMLGEWSDVFAKDDLDVGLTSVVKHRINLTDPEPFKQKCRRIPPAMFSEVRKHLRQLLDSNIIRKSRSPWSSNVVLVRKRDSSLRLCVDFRQLNQKTIKDAYALPRIDELLEKLGGNSYYSVLDMKSGYHQVEVCEEHKERTAFTVGPLGFYEYNRLPFGLSNAPATYQRLMEECLDDLVFGEEQVCQIYLDDVIIASRTIEEHFDRLKQVFARFREIGMKLAPKKCHLFQEKVRYVGHIVSADGVGTDPDKTRHIAEWPVPVNTDELRTFLGFCGYYRKFVRDFSKIARPLNDLLVGAVKKKKPFRKTHPNTGSTSQWQWLESQQDAFDTLKAALTSPPVLAYPDFSKPFVLHTDASRLGLGAVLYQSIDGKQCVIAYASRGLNKAEQNYPVHKLEFLALKWAISHKFHDYLYGNTFVVYTDNNPLTYVLQKAKLDATGHRWIAALGSYNFSIKYKPGHLNRDADALSRMPQDTHSSEFVEIPSSSIQTICSQVDCVPYAMSLAISASVPVGNEDDQVVPRDWRKLQHQDPTVGLFLRAVTNRKRPNSLDINSRDRQVLLKEFSKLMVNRGVLYRKILVNGESKLQLVLPRQFRVIALEKSHNDVGHLGRDKTLGILRERVYWPNMYSDVEQWIRSCDRCVKRKTPTNMRAPLVSITTSQPMELVCMDYLTLETSKGGYQHILVITDHFTKYAVAVPMRNQSAKLTAEALFNNFIVHYGIPKRIHSDQGANFQGKLLQELYNITGITRSRTTPYHPEGNGITERLNRTLLGMLGTLRPDQKQNWKAHVGPLVHAYNCTKHDVTRFSPHQLMFGRQPRLALDIVLGLVNEEHDVKDYSNYMATLKNSLATAYRLATSNSRSGQHRQKVNYDVKVRGAVLDVGDRLLVRILAFDGKHKISDHWENSPYIVLEQSNPEIPVYSVQREDGEGPVKKLHRNHLLPIGSLPMTEKVDLDPIMEPELTDTVDTPIDESQQHSESDEDDDNFVLANEPQFQTERVSERREESVITLPDNVADTPRMEISTDTDDRDTESVHTEIEDEPETVDLLETMEDNTSEESIDDYVLEVPETKPVAIPVNPVIAPATPAEPPIPAPRRSLRNCNKPVRYPEGVNMGVKVDGMNEAQSDLSPVQLKVIDLFFNKVFQNK